MLALILLIFSSWPLWAGDTHPALKPILAMPVKWALMSEVLMEPLIEKLGTVEKTPSQSGKPPTRYRLYNNSLRATLSQVQKQQGQVDLDCFLFAQIAALILEERATLSKFTLFPMGTGDLALTSIFYNRPFGYVHLKELKDSDTLMKTSFANKGQWVLRVGDNEFLGLTFDGPQVLSAEAWVEKTRQGLKHELAQRQSLSRNTHIDPDDCETKFQRLDFVAAVEMNLLHAMDKLGKLENWQLTEYELPAGLTWMPKPPKQK